MSENVTITLVPTVASLVNGNADKTQKNIQTNGGDIILKAQGTGSIGTSIADPLVIDAASGSLKIQTPDGKEVITVDTYLELKKDTKLTPDNIVVDGVEYKVVGKVQNSENPEDRVDITCGSLRVINGGKADITTDGTMRFTYLGVDDHDSTGDSQATLTAAQSIAIGTLVTADGTTSLTSTGSSVTVTKLTASESANVTVQAQTQFNSDELDANAATVTVTSNGSAAVGKLKATEKANVTVKAQTQFNSDALNANAATVKITSTGSSAAVKKLTATESAEVEIKAQTQFNSDALNATKAATVTVTSNGSAAVGKLTATEKANVTVQAQSQFDSDELNANAATVKITSTGSSAAVKKLTASESAEVEIKAQTQFDSDALDATKAATVTITSNGSAAVGKLTATERANVTVKAQTQFESDALDATKAATVTITSNGSAAIDNLTASEIANVEVHTAGDITLGSLRLEDAVAVFTSLNGPNGYALPNDSGITGGGKFTAAYVEADRSRLEIDVWDDLRIFDETGDEASNEDAMKNVLVLRDMHGSESVGTTTVQRGAFLTSRNGAVDSTHDDYNVYTDANGNAYFEQDGQWYAFECGGDSRSFIKLEAAPNLTGYTNGGKYSLYIGTSDENASNYLPTYAGKLILERSGDFYQIAASGIEKDTHLSSSFMDAQKLLNVGVRNYYDSWFTDNVDLTVTAYGDIQIRDSLLLTNRTEAKLTSNAGGIIVADYYMDTDGDGIGNKLQPSRYLVKNSVAALNAGGGDVRTDRVYVETSFAAIDDCTGDVNSKTWYILGSKFPINLEGDVTVVCLDADNASAAPAAQILWCNKDFYIHLLMDGTEKYIQTGVEITSINGGVHIECMDGDVSSSNTLDLYAVASTVDIQAKKNVVIPEMELNTPNSGIKLDDGTPATSNVYHDRIYKRDENGNYTKLTAEAIPDPAEHAYGTEMDIASEDGGFIASHIKVDSALTSKGDLYAAHGISRLNVTTGGDIEVIYNLSDRTPDHIEQYGENIADRALTIRDASTALFQSGKGKVSVLGHDSSVCEEDILLVGTAGQTAVLQLIADDILKTGSVKATDANLYLRTTGVETDSVNNDILVDRILGTNVKAELDSAGNINAYSDNTSLLLKLDGEASLRLAAAEDIGKLKQLAHIDVPCTVLVDKVNNFYADLNLRDSDDNQIFEQIKEYAITQGYLTSDAAAMVQKLISIREDDYLGHSDLRFYNILLSEETMDEIRKVLDLEAEQELTADDLVNGFALLDDETRSEVLSSLYGAAVSNGQGLEDVEAALTEQENALQKILAEKQKLSQRLGQEKPMTDQELAQCENRYKELVKLESDIRAGIQELNRRKAEIQDGYRAYTSQDPEMDALMAEAQALHDRAEKLDAESDQLITEAAALRTDLDALLAKLADHNAFNVASLETARIAAQVVLDAANAAAEKINAAEQAALDLAVTCGEEDRKAAAEALDAIASLAAAMNDFVSDAHAGAMKLNNTFVDVPARSSQVVIGQIGGELYLNNEGDIHVLVDSGRQLTSIFDQNPAGHIVVAANPVLIGQILSRRGDVTIENVNDAIEAKKLDAEEPNILADEIILKANGSIGSEKQPLVTEQQNVTPSKIVTPAEDVYKNQTADETVSGSTLPGKGVIGIQLAERYDELRDDTEQVEVVLLMADGTQLKTDIQLQDLRQLTRLANTTDGCVYNFLTDEKASLAALQVVVRYDWVRYLDPVSGTRTDAESENGSIYLSELTGTMNIGQILAKDDIGLSAPDGVYSVLTEEEIVSFGKQNIQTTGNDSQITVNAGTGGVGESVNPLRVGTSGDNPLMTTTSEDGVYLRGTGDLKLEFEDTSRHIEVELIGVTGNGTANLTVNETTIGESDTLTGYAKSLGSLELHTAGNIGTQDTPFEIATDASKGGTLRLTGDNVFILQAQGDLLAENLKAEGDLKLTVTGSILDASTDSRLTELLNQYRQQLANTNAAQEELDKLLAEWNAIMNNDMDEKRKQELAEAKAEAAQAQAKVDEATEELRAAEDAMAQAKKDLSNASATGDKDAIEAAQNAVDQAKKVLDEKAEALAQANAQNKVAQEVLNGAEAIEAKFIWLEKTKENLREAYAKDTGISDALRAFEEASEAVAFYTDYVKRAQSKLEIAEEILKDAFGADFRTALKDAPAEVVARYQPLIAMLDEAQRSLDQAMDRLNTLNGDANTDGSIEQAEKRLEKEQAELEALIRAIQEDQQNGASLAIQVGRDATIEADRSIAGNSQDPDGYVSIQVGGQLDVETDGDVRLITPEAITIGQANTNGNGLHLISLKDVKVDFTDAEEFSGAGNNISVDLKNNVDLGDVIADGDVDITAGGDVDQKPGTAIRADGLQIHAGGSVDVDVYADNILVTAGDRVNITSGKSDLTLDGITAGNDVSIDGPGNLVSGGGLDIDCGGNVLLNMGGNIGSIDKAITIRADGGIDAISRYGLCFVHRVFDVAEAGEMTEESTMLCRLWDDPAHREYYIRRADGALEKYLRPGTGLEVFGAWLHNAFLWVGTEQLRLTQFADAKNLTHLTIRVLGKTVFDYCVAIDRIVEWILSNDVKIPVIEQDRSGRYAGQYMTYRYYVGSEYNGYRYTVTVEQNGTICEVIGTVRSGYISFTTCGTAASITVDLVSEV